MRLAHVCKELLCTPRAILVDFARQEQELYLQLAT